MQYTGLKDKNGKEIYERDILATSNDGTDGCDIWEEEIFSDPVSFNTTFFQYDGLPDEDEQSMYNVKYCYVKGNIYENPELR
jgi:uncharacterized phage protein (TIGR01671 family)